jgi:hypothetical protein
MDDSFNPLYLQMSERQLRLFACACARQVFSLFGEKWPQCVMDVVERFAEGSASPHELAIARNVAFARVMDAHRDVAWIAARGYASLPEPHACSAAWWTARGTALSAAAALAAAGESSLDGARMGARILARAGAQHVLPNLLSDIAGPARWRSPGNWSARALSLAEKCYRGDPLHPHLADALDELGETEAAAHCRRPLHVKGCWVVDHILGKG